MATPVVLQKGFRPFFLVGAAWGAVVVPWWVAGFRSSAGEAVGEGISGLSWHAHEMIFGFTAAIIAGFLLTATENWTSRPTARGPFLAVLVGLWTVGRGVGLGEPFASLAALAELSFLPTLAVAVGLPILITRRSRNYLLLAVLPLLWLCDVHLHLVANGLLAPSSLRSDLVAVDLVVLIMVIITGRIVPLFTRNATGDERIRSIRSLDLAAIAAVLTVAVVEALLGPGMVRAVVAAAAGLLVLGRAVHWGLLATLRRPILWVLHLGHAWIGVGLLLSAAASAGLGPAPSVATHALTVGAMGTLIIAMLVRVTVGHTGRTIEASPLMTLAFVAMTTAALARVVIPWLRPDLNTPALVVAAAAWTLALALYLLGNTRILLSPRPDGREG